jgi:hypothetical protein
MPISTAGPRPDMPQQLALGDRPAARALPSLRHVLGHRRHRGQLDVGDLMGGAVPLSRLEPLAMTMLPPITARRVENARLDMHRRTSADLHPTGMEAEAQIDQFYANISRYCHLPEVVSLVGLSKLRHVRSRQALTLCAPTSAGSRNVPVRRL